MCLRSCYLPTAGAELPLQVQICRRICCKPGPHSTVITAAVAEYSAQNSQSCTSSGCKGALRIVRTGSMQAWRRLQHAARQA